MALLDLQPVDMSNGVRVYPKTQIKIKFASDKESKLTSMDSEIAYRKAFKTDQIQLAPIKFRVVEVEDDEMESDDVPMASTYYRSEEKTTEQIEEKVEYDLDEEDQVWLDEENKKREQKKKKKIKEEIFELAIDRLEKETYFKDGGPHEVHSMDGSESLDDDCCICGNGDVENTNQIIYCDMCNIAVHQDCYGVPYIPEGQWLCRKCKLSPMEPVKCELCPLRDGAFKPTGDGKWAHVVCAIWLNEVHFGNTAFLEPIEGVQNSLRRRQRLRCLVCRVKVGACLQCSKGSCVKSFHVTCAMQARLQMLTDAVPDSKSPDGLSVKRFVYCHVHGSVAVGDNEFAKNKKRAIEAIHRARRRMLTDAAIATHAPIPTLDPEAKKRIEERVGEKSVVEDIMGFWFYKRKKRCGMPLIRRLQVKKKAVVRVSTPRGEVTRKGRIMYEKARLLVELVQKREKNYLENITVERKLLSQFLVPLEDILAEFIRSLYDLDTHKFFRDDPLKQNLVNYNSIVKKPMYLSLMKKNAEKGVYKTEAEMKEHLDLIFKNCEQYNKANELVILYAKQKQHEINESYIDLVEYLKMARKWLHDRSLTVETKKEAVKEEKNKVKVKEERKKSVVKEVKKKEVKEEPKEPQKEVIEAAPTPREESNRRKRKAEEPKTEDLVETPSVKRDRRTRDRDIGTPKQEAFSCIFQSATLAPNQSTTVRRFSLGSISPTIASNSNKSHRRLTRGSTHNSFSSYREMPSVLSPMGVTSCDSAVESDMEISRPDSRSFHRSFLSDPNSLHHGDLVKVNGTTGRIIMLTEGSIEDPQLTKVYSELKPVGEVLVEHFKREPKYARYDYSSIAPLNITKDKVEGMREAREYHSRIICSK